MNETLIAGLLASAQHLGTAGQALTSASESLKAIATALKKAEDEAAKVPPGGTLYKKPNGRLTEAGVAAVFASYDAGATVTEVSEQYNIHTSAASYRHTQWMNMRGGTSA